MCTDVERPALHGAQCSAGNLGAGITCVPHLWDVDAGEAFADAPHARRDSRDRELHQGDLAFFSSVAIRRSVPAQGCGSSNAQEQFPVAGAARVGLRSTNPGDWREATRMKVMAPDYDGNKTALTIMNRCSIWWVLHQRTAVRGIQMPTVPSVS